MAFSPDGLPSLTPPGSDTKPGIVHHKPTFRERMIFWQFCCLHGHDYQDWIEIYCEWIAYESDPADRCDLVKCELRECRRQNTMTIIKACYHLLAAGAAILAIASFVLLS